MMCWHDSYKFQKDFHHFFNFPFRLLHKFFGVFQPMFMALFTWSLLAISAALFIIQVELVELIFLLFKVNYFSNILESKHCYFSCSMENLWRYCWQFSLGSSHSFWYSLFVSLAKEWAKLSIELISKSISWTGICYQSNCSDCCQWFMQMHNSQSNWSALEVWHALERFSKVLVHWN